MKRPVQWMAGAISLVVVVMACTVPDLSALGPFPCTESSACASGYVCAAGQCVLAGTEPGGVEPGGNDGGVEPGGNDGGVEPGGADAGSDAGVLVDTTPPTLTFSAPSPSLIPTVGKTVYSEIGTDGKTFLPAAWRRDQEVTVELKTDTPLPMSFEVKGTDGVATRLDVVTFTAGCDARQCGRVTVPLWRPRLDGMRGSFPFTATARDEAGNVATQGGSFLVSRWKWSYLVYSGLDTKDSIDGTPAVGEKGTVYVTTYNTALKGLSPEGRELWALSGEGTPVVGNPGDGRETLYARGYWNSGSGEGHMLLAYDMTDGHKVAQCPEPLIPDLYFDAFALASGGNPDEVVVTVTNGGPDTDTKSVFLGLGAGPSGGSPQCQSVQTDLYPSERGNVVIRGPDIYFSGPDDDATSVKLGEALPRTGWPIKSGSDEGVNAMAFFGDLLVMGEGDVGDSSSDGAISTVNVESPRTAQARYSGGAIFSPVVGQGGIAFGVDRRRSRLVRTPLTGSPSNLTSQETTLASSVTPALGQGGLVYASTRSFELGVWSASDLSFRWKWGPGGVPSSSKMASPTLDCTRDASGVPVAGRPGVLYASIYNHLYAIIVDSAGLDADAPWPKHQHDARNTANPATPLTRCP